MSKLYDGWVRNIWRKEDADLQIIKLQKYFIGLLFVLSAAFFIGWMTSPSRLTVYIPPNIQNGATMKVGTIPTPLIYSFAYEVWQEINIALFVLLWPRIVQWVGKNKNALPKQIHYWQAQRFRLAIWFVLFEILICENLIGKLFYGT